MNWWDDSVGKALSRPDVAGALGALLGSFLGIVPGASRSMRMLNAAAGVVIAYYFGPFVADLLGVSSQRGQTAIGFLTGMLGLATLLQVSVSLKGYDWRTRIDALLDHMLGSRKS